MRNENRIKKLEEIQDAKRVEVDRAREVLESMIGSSPDDSERVEHALELLRKGSTMAEAIVETFFWSTTGERQQR